MDYIKQTFETSGHKTKVFMKNKEGHFGHYVVINSYANLKNWKQPTKLLNPLVSSWKFNFVVAVSRDESEEGKKG